VPPVHHLGLCDDATAAGEHFNTCNIALIKQRLETGEALGSYTVLSDLLSSEIQRLMPMVVNTEIADGGTPPMIDSFTSINQEIMAEYMPVEEGIPALEDEDGYQVAGGVELQPPSGYHLALKKYPMISSFGEVITHDVSFDPTVNVFEEVIDDPPNGQTIYRIIQVDCPQVPQEQIEWEDGTNGVKITICKPKAIDEAKITKLCRYPIRQQYGTWEQEFEFPKEEGNFEILEDACCLKNGVLKIVLRKSSRFRRSGFSHVQEPTQFLPTPRSADYRMRAASSFRAGSSGVYSESTEKSC
jgi:hypothetical protein